MGEAHRSVSPPVIQAHTAHVEVVGWLLPAPVPDHPVAPDTTGTPDVPVVLQAPPRPTELVGCDSRCRKPKCDGHVLQVEHNGVSCVGNKDSVVSSAAWTLQPTVAAALASVHLVQSKRCLWYVWRPACILKPDQWCSSMPHPPTHPGSDFWIVGIVGWAGRVVIGPRNRRADRGQYGASAAHDAPVGAHAQGVRDRRYPILCALMRPLVPTPCSTLSFGACSQAHSPAMCIRILPLFLFTAPQVAGRV
jgi:hypothetical protein